MTAHTPCGAAQLFLQVLHVLPADSVSCSLLLPGAARPLQACCLVTWGTVPAGQGLPAAAAQGAEPPRGHPRDLPGAEPRAQQGGRAGGGSGGCGQAERAEQQQRALSEYGAGGGR